MTTDNDDWISNPAPPPRAVGAPAHQPPRRRGKPKGTHLRPIETLAAELDDPPIAAEPAAMALGPDGAPDRPDDSPEHHGPPDGGPGRPHGEIWEGCPVRPLGVSGKFSWYLDVLGQLRGVDNHTLQTMLHLFGGNAALLSWHHPSFNKDGGRAKGKFNQLSLSAAMISACRERGVWSPTGRLREAGAWTDDDGALVYHAGDEVLIGGRWQPPGVYDGKTYPAVEPIPRPADDARGDPGRELLDQLETWHWRRRDMDPILTLGLICAQMMGGALDWRPVGWFTGDASTGKSNLQRLILYVHGGEKGLLQAADATEAGIRSVVGNSSLPVAVDELEPDKDNPRKVQAVIELARRAASGGQIFRGSTDQKGYQGTAQSAFLFSSILVPPMPAQDRSRLILLDLDRFPPDAPKWRPDPRALRRIGAQLRRRLIDGWASWAERLELWRAALATHGQHGRGADNYATVLAMADMALRRDLPGSDELDGWARKLGKAVTDESVEVGTNADDMLTHLLGQAFDVYRRGEKYTVAQWLQVAAALPAAPHGLIDSASTDARMRASEANAKLAKVGLRVYGEGLDATLFIANERIQGLLELFQDSQWQQGVWAQAARRLPGAAAVKHPATLAGIRTRGVIIPFSAIPGLAAFPMDRAAAEPYPHPEPDVMEDFA